MKRWFWSSVTVGLAGLVLQCSDTESSPTPATAGSGGNNTSGGAGPMAGGTTGDGGTSTSGVGGGGGDPGVAGSAGDAPIGGSDAAGGSAGTGGSSDQGGAGGTEPTAGSAGSAGEGGSPTAGAGGQGGQGGQGGSEPTAGTGGSGGSAGAPPQIGCTPQGNMPALQATEIVDGLDRPVELVGLPDEPNVLWVIEHRGNGTPSTGRVRSVTVNGNNGTLSPQAVLTIQVNSRGNDEEGLHSIALHPNFVENQLFYIFFSAPNNSNTTVDEYRKTGTSSSTRVRNVYTASSPAQYHNGGQIDFAPGDANNLYISLGENQQPDQAQNDNSPHGKILRINLANGNTTQIHKGLRNPWRFSFDDQTGDMYIADVGHSGANTERLFFAAAGVTGLNFGWRSGNTRSGGAPALHSSFDAGTPIIGGFVYRGNKPGLQGFCGRYIFGTYGSGGQFTTLRVNAQGQATDVRVHNELNAGDLTAFGRDAYGEIYYVDYSDGTVLRIDPD